MKYQINHENGRSNLAVYLDGELSVCDSDHPNWNLIMEALGASDGASIPDLIDLPKAVAQRFERVSDRVAVSDGVVYFDGDAIHNSLADAILRAMREGADFRSLTAFMEKCYQNPRKHSRENLFDWLSTHDFTITPDGDLVGYKGIGSDFRSLTAGPGIVNGVGVNGHLDNSVGNVLEIARSNVQHDPSVGCSTGLHVGTWAYASGFGPVTAKVIVNPRDVVSVPTDCSWAKMRVCRYTVDSIIERPVTTFVDPSWDDDWDEEDEGWDYGY